MNREDIIKKISNQIIANCQDFPDYNDNTLYDFLMFGFKGLTNMSDAELEHDLRILTVLENEE